MGQLLLLVVGALAVGAIGFGIAALISGGDPGLEPVEPDGRAVPLPGSRPLGESDVAAVRFDTALRGYRMAQVDAALRRAAYDIGYKEELISVLEAEVAALREGRVEDADALRRAREAALRAASPAEPEPIELSEPGEPTFVVEAVDAAEAAEPAEAVEPAQPAQPAQPPAGDRDGEAGEHGERRDAPAAGDQAPAWSSESDDSWRRAETKLG